MNSNLSGNIKDVLSGKKKFTFKKLFSYIKFLLTSKSYSANLKRFTNPQPFTGPKEEAVSEHAGLHNIFKNHDNYASVKWEQYLPIYERIFAPFILRGKAVDILEIGILNGGFLEILGKFFPKNTQILGVDINEKCSELTYDKNITVKIGDATKKEFVENALKDMYFDIIIDDASHMCKDVINTFNLTFGRVKPGGIYVIEDCHTSYWSNYDGGFRKKLSIVEYFKNLADAVNFYYIDPKKVSKKDFHELKRFKSTIAAVSFYDSVIVIEKYAKEKTAPFRNYVTGKKDLIMPKQEYIKDGAIECNDKTVFEKFFS